MFGVARMTTRRELLKGVAAGSGVATLSSSQFFAEAKARLFDYVVVGSGPGGGPLACRLAKAGHTVCLMEAGGAANDPDTRRLMEVPAFNPKATADPNIAWEYFVRHYADDAQQIKDSKYVAAKAGILYPRASAIGGCTVHSALLLLYASDSDWEYIANLTGDGSWAPDLMRAYFRRIERCRYVAAQLGDTDEERHGFDGWQPTELPNPHLFYDDPQFRQMLYAAERLMGTSGDVDLLLQNRLDPNDYAVTKSDRQGLYTIPLSTQKGSRFSLREHVLQTAASFPNLTIMTNCLVTRVLLDGDVAIGVEYMRAPHLYRASPLSDPKASAPRPMEIRAAREVIIAAGTFNSPQILKLSGIGSPDELSKFGIKTRIELPGVGTGMMDRYEVSVVTEVKDPFGLYAKCVPKSPTNPCMLDWRQGKGIYATNGLAISGIRKSDASRPDRDLIISLTSGPFHGYHPGWENDFSHPTQFSWLVLKAHTNNRAGTVTLRSGDPRDPPAINFHYFEEGTDHDGEDLASVVNGVQLIRQLNAQFPGHVSSELRPGPGAQSAAEIAAFVRNEAWGHHASCSNRMGARGDPMAVVDSEFKVFGARHLRVVDASVFPRIPGYFITVPIFMISEKAADVVLADARRAGKSR